jgi:DHA1 family multidrug resistance protein-like MFS transporter
MVCALILAGLVSLPQAAVASIPELFALRVLASFALGSVIPVANLAVRASVPAERQGEAFGIAASATSVAFGVGPLGGGLLAASFGFGAPFLVPGVLLLAASVALLVLTLPSMPRYARLCKLVLANLVS